VAEKARLEKALAKVEADIAKISSKLSNEKFVENAKPELVEAEREKLAELEGQKESLLVALSRIAEAG
jgi:valyl-tRNA synthetase